MIPIIHEEAAGTADDISAIDVMIAQFDMQHTIQCHRTVDGDVIG